MKQTALDLGLSTSSISRTFATLEASKLVKLVQLKEGGAYRAFLRPFPLEKVPPSREAGEP